MKQKRVLPLILAATMLISIFQGILPVTGAEKTMVTVDASASNWTPVYLSGSNVEGGAAFSGNAGTYGTGTTLNTKLDVTEAVEFDLKFTTESMAVDSLFAITFGVDANSFNQGEKGTTFIMYKKAANVIQCGQGGGEWREYTHASAYTYRFVKETDGWALYLKGAGADQTDIQLGKIGFDTFAEDGFADGQATFGVYLYDATNTTNEVAFEVTNVKHMNEVEATEEPTERTMVSVDASASNWTPVYLIGSNVEGGAAFSGNAGTYGTGTTLNTKLDVTEAVEFDLKFTTESMADESLFAITFGVDANSFNQEEKGTTFIMYKKAANVIQCGQGGGEWREYTHASVYTYRFVKETDGWALYLKGAGADQTDIQLGKIGFDTFAEDGFADGQATFGVYLYDATNTTNEVAFEVTNVKHMTMQQEDEGGETGNVLDAYDLETYTQPYWMGDTVYNESVMILKNQDGSIPAVQLLYPATEIISVRSSDLQTEYVKGIDWDIENGKLVILENSSIPYMTYEEYYPNGTGLETVDGKWIYFTEGNFFHSKQIAVTYKHTAVWSWSVPKYKGSQMPKTIAKLQNNESLKIVFYGDSITTGANSSGMVGAAPYAATWMTMFEESLEKAYGNNNITSVNTAVAGMTSGWGVENVQERVVNQNPDLLVIAFGMNDGNGSSVSPEEYKNNINTIIQAAKGGNPDVEILLVSPMLPNPEVKMTEGNQASYEAELIALETEGITVAPVTTMYKYLMANKRYYDMTGNNVNHPNDFVARLYAQTLNAVLIYADLVEVEPAERTMVSVDASASNWTPVYLIGSNVEGGAAFSGNAGTYGTGTTLNTKLDVTEAVEFDLKFTTESMADESLFAITFGVDVNSFNQGEKGTTFIMYKKAANVIQCGQGGGEWREYTHASVYTYRFAKETDGWALYLKGAGADQTDIQLGKIGFDTFAADGFANGKATFGIYVYDAGNTEEIVFEVTNVKHMTMQQEDEGGETGNVLDAYDLETYTKPYWEGDTVYHESVLIVKNQDGSIPATRLLYPATEIISVRSSDLKTEYVKGTDWDIENGKLVILENSSIPFMTYEEYYPNRAGSDAVETLDGRWTYFTEGSFFHKKQIAVTYKHTANWNWSVPEYKGNMMPKTIEKLRNNEPVKIVFYGASTVAGSNSSSVVNAAPYAPTAMMMFEESLKKAYGNENITSVNTAVGGTTSVWGVENVQERVVDHNPDLVVIEFGGNDGVGGAISTESFKANIEAIIQAAKAGNPDVEIMIVSPMVNSPEVKWVQGIWNEYEAHLLSLETEGVIVVPVNSMCKYLLANKRYCDITGNNVNHPNDFYARLYAQVLNASMIYAEPIEEVLYPENTYVLTTNDEYWDCVNNASVSNGVVTLGESGLVNYIGSKLKNDLALFDMEAVIPAEKWVGFMAKQSNAGASPWEQDCYFVIVKDNGEVQLLKCKNGAMEVITTSNTDAVQNGVLSKTTVRFGVLTQEEGTRIVLDIAGRNILNYLDSIDPIATDGYTGFITLETATAKLYTGNNGVDPNESDDKVESILYPEYTYELPSNDEYWQVIGNGTVSDGVVSLNESSTANYYGSELDDKLAQFDLEAELPAETWVGFMAKQTKTGDAPWEQDCYLVIVKDNGEVQLLKSVSGAFVQLAGARTTAVENRMIARTTVRFGVLVEDEGARIIFDIGGKNIINYLDTQNPYTESGHTGICTLESATARVYLTGEREEVNDGNNSGYTGGTINPDYIVDWPQIEDYIYTGTLGEGQVHVDEISDSLDVTDIIAKIKSPGSVDVVIALTETPVIDESIFDVLTGRDKHFIIKIVDEDGNILSTIDYYGMDLKTDSEDNTDKDPDGNQSEADKPSKDEGGTGSETPDTEQNDTENADAEQNDTENADAEQNDTENTDAEQNDTENTDTEQGDTEIDAPSIDDEKDTQISSSTVIVLLILAIIFICLFAVLLLLYLRKLNSSQESEVK